MTTLNKVYYILFSKCVVSFLGNSLKTVIITYDNVVTLGYLEGDICETVKLVHIFCLGGLICILIIALKLRYHFLTQIHSNS